MHGNNKIDSLFIVYKNKKYLLLCLICLFVISQKAYGQPNNVIVAWGETEYQETNIYFTERINQKWSNPKRLSFSKNPEVMPTLISNKKGEIWVVWTELLNIGGKLQFSLFKNGRWMPPQQIRTNTTSDMAPSTIVDQNGDVWLAWSGTDMGDDEIYSSRWHNGRWGEPMRVNADDGWPDVLPQMSLTEEGTLKISWSGYDGKKYRVFYSLWSGTNWGPEELSFEAVDRVSQSMAESAGVDMDTIISDLPVFITDINQATIHFRNHGRANTIRLRDKR